MTKFTIKKISFTLLITSWLLLLVTTSLAERDTTSYIATPGGWTIYSDKEFMEIRANQEERFKKEKIYLEKLKKQKQKKENKIKIEKLEKDFNAQVNHINSMINEWTSKCKILTKKTYNSLNAQQYAINSLKESIWEQKTNFRKGYYYNLDNNTCIETSNYIWNNTFPSREKCNICSEWQKASSWIVVIAEVEPVITEIKKIWVRTYSDQILGNIADNIMKNKSNTELLELQKRAKNLINTLENWNLNIKESTKVNFLKLLKIIDWKILVNTSIYTEKKVETKKAVEQFPVQNNSTNTDEELDTDDFLKGLFGDDF